jgi:hypothetical protein
MADRTGKKRSAGAILVTLGTAIVAGQLAIAAADPAAAAQGGSTPDGLDGSYNIVSISDRIGVSGFGRAAGAGQLSIDSQHRRIHFDYAQNTQNLSGGCPAAKAAPGPCNRRFDRSQWHEAVQSAGSYELLSDGTLNITLDAPNPLGLPTQGGFVNAKSGVVVLTSRSDQGSDVLVAVKHTDRDGKHAPPGYGRPMLSGRYAYNARDIGYPGSIASVQGRWESYESAVQYGDVSILGPGYVLADHGTQMQQALTCVSAAGGCSTQASLDASQQAVLLFGEVSAGAGGRVRLEPEHAHGLSPDWAGVVTQDGAFAALTEEAQSAGHEGVSFLVRKGSGLSNATVVGSYNAVALEEFFDSDSGVRSAFVNGKIVFGSDNSWTFNGTDSSTKRSECAGSEPCPSPGLFSRSVMGGASGSYSVTSEGALSMVGVAGDNTPRVFDGETSSDGTIVILRRVVDAGACSFDCTGTESARSVIIAIRP